MTPQRRPTVRQGGWAFLPVSVSHSLWVAPGGVEAHTFPGIRIHGRAILWRNVWLGALSSNTYSSREIDKGDMCAPIASTTDISTPLTNPLALDKTHNCSKPQVSYLFK